MKVIGKIALLICFIPFGSNAQKSVKKYLTSDEIIGKWQRDSKIVGSGMNQYIHFFPNGDFHMDLGNDGDDLRTVIELDGKYRIVQDSLFFTITQKTIILGGEIATNDWDGLQLSLFTIKNGKMKYILISNPKELEPCFISLITNEHIKINNEEYFKISFIK